ncbi:MAG TPA: hypothetical protein VGJ78_06495 [Vicinamibacterales bacterium]
MQREQLQRDRPLEIAVVSLVHLAHAARADERHELVPGNLLPLEVYRRRALAEDDCRCFQKRIGELVRREQFFHVLPQRRVASACRGDVGRAVAHRQRSRALEHLFDPRPVVGTECHGEPPSRAISGGIFAHARGIRYFFGDGEV